MPLNVYTKHTKKSMQIGLLEGNEKAPGITNDPRCSEGKVVLCFTIPSQYSKTGNLATDLSFSY